MSYLLDTNICIDALRGHPHVRAQLTKVSPADCSVSTVTAYELMTGARKSNQSEREVRKVERLLSAVAVLPFDQAAAKEASIVRQQLESTGRKIGPYDVLIAGHALSAGLTLVTNNLREFERVQGLELLDWRAE